MLLSADLHGVFGVLVAYGEVIVGIALLVGAFTGVAAFFGALMNWNFMLAGTASTNPVLGIVAIAVIVAWKTAGWWQPAAGGPALPASACPWLPDQEGPRPIFNSNPEPKIRKPRQAPARQRVRALRSPAGN